MIARTATPPAAVFAAATGGTLRTGGLIGYPDGSYVKANLLGRVRLHRYTKITVELGTWSDGDALVRAYERAVSR